MSAYGKNTLRTIFGNKRRALALLAISALGVAFFVGMRSTAPDMRVTFERYYDERAMYDSKVMGTLGLTDGHIHDLAAVQGVEKIEPVYETDLFARSGEASYLIRFHAYAPDSVLAKPMIVQGNLPQMPGECALEYRFAQISGLGVGDTLALTTGDDTSLDSVLTRDLYVVTGLITSPLYVRADRGSSNKGSGTLDAYAYIPFSDFALEAYTGAVLTVANPEGFSRFDDAFQDISAAVEEQLQEIGDDFTAARRRMLIHSANRAVEAAGRQIRATRDALTAGQRELDEAARILTDNELALAVQRQMLQSTYQAELLALSAQGDELAAARQSVAEGKRAIAKERAAAKAAYAEAPEQLALIEAQLHRQEEELAQAETEIDEQELQWLAGSAQLDEASQAAHADLLAAQAACMDARADWQEQVRAFDALTAQTEAALFRAEAELASAVRAKEAIPDDAKYYVLGQDQSIGFAGYEQDCERIDAISRVFPLIFFLVAALVAFTSMVRIVEDERPTVAAMRSLGYGPGRIMGMYLLYAVCVGVPGTALGIAIGYRLFPAVIFNFGYKILYILPPIETPLYGSVCAQAFAVSLVSICAPTILVAAADMRLTPAELLRPKAPPPGKRVILERITAVWRLLSFSAKVTARNILRYKKRFLMTVTGIVGCTAVMLTGFGVRDSIRSIPVSQFDRLFLYTFHLSFAEDAARSDRLALERYLSAQSDVTGWQYQHRQNMDAVSPDGTLYETALVIPETTEDFSQFIQLIEPGTGAVFSLPEQGVVITQKLALLLNLTIGDMLVLRDEDSVDWQVTIAGVTENYAGHYLYMTDSHFQSVFGEKPDYRDIVCGLAGYDDARRDQLSEMILENDAVSALTFKDNARDFYVDTINSLNVVVLVLILSGALLAFSVLFSLTGINIDERKRELATLKVLGFYDNEASSYIFRENIVNTVIGVGLGLPCGMLLHQYVIHTAEIDIMMFGRAIAPGSYGLAAALTFLFLMIVNAVMAGSIRDIDMIESLKSVE